MSTLEELAAFIIKLSLLLPEDMMPTIVTTNNISTIADPEVLLRPRLIDRFFEGKSRLLLFDWESYRRFGKVSDGILARTKRSTTPSHLTAVAKDA